METQVLTYKYRLLPSKKQHKTLHKILDDQRFLYNCALQERIGAWKNSKKSLSYMTQCKSLTVVRHEIEGWGDYPVSMQRGTLLRLNDAFKGFFRRCKRGEKPGYPRFKSKDGFASFDFAEFKGIRFDGKRVRFGGMCGGIRVHLHRPVPNNKIINVRIKKDIKGWVIYFVVKVAAENPRPGFRSIGLDLGVTTLVMLSNGGAIPNPRVAKKAERQVRKKQRALSRCKKKSNTRRKMHRGLIAAHIKITNIRRTYLHQVSARLVRDYDIIAVEKLQIRNMVKNPRLARSINDASWGTLIEMLRYKAAKAGARLIEVDPRNTSQACSGCGTIVPKRLSERWHCCPECGLELDRDVNAARNVLHRAVLRPELLNVGQWAERATGNLVGAIQ